MRHKFLFILIILAAAGVYFFRGGLRLERLQNQVLPRLSEVQREVQTGGALRAAFEKPTFLTRDGIIKWTNVQRQQAGLPELTVEGAFNLSAEKKVRDMFVRQYFAHQAPTGENVGDLAQDSGYQFIAIGENLALGNFGDDQILVQAWMDSPGHRANILSSSYEEIGVAAGKGIFEGKATWFAVQHFGRPVSSCPEVDKNLRAQIEQNNAEIQRLKAEISAQREALKSHSGSREEYEQKVVIHNETVLRHNQMVAQTAALAEQYNAQVREFNRCIAE